ncbi:MAG TPA: nuclear transport factor 2 family protein [Steroidobacter sp.]|uniref:nuclear transport factor 2 family protein n=1 Tax=Steroidobacter sp. TaxID=1978227 RepID=UPI002ED8CD87
MSTNHFAEASSPEQQVTCVMSAYIEVTNQADGQRARTLFHPNAVVSGDGLFGVQTGTPEPFFEALESALKRPSETGYKARVQSVRVFGNTAIGEVVEENLLGYDFTNHFHLLQTDGGWLIVSKLYRATATNSR